LIAFSSFEPRRKPDFEWKQAILKQGELINIAPESPSILCVEIKEPASDL
jgi:hypothetical protein